MAHSLNTNNYINHPLLHGVTSLMAPKRKYLNMLDLELDDWLDPSLPRMYDRPDSPTDTCPDIGPDEFTTDPAFVATTVNAPFQPPRMGADGEVSLIPIEK